MDLKGNLKKEYNCLYTNDQRFMEYYQGEHIEEFIDLPKIVYNEWRFWKNYHSRIMFDHVEKNTFDKFFQEFKNFWQYNTPETHQVFREMSLLSKKMLDEWRIKYSSTQNRTKAELWEEFKIIWDLNPENYSEELLNEYLTFIDKIESDYKTNYFDEYPRNFEEFVEDSKYYSSSVLEKYSLCKDWDNYTRYY